MLNDEHGLAVSPRRVTLSTVGLVPMLDRLAAEPLMPNLAISLHATTEEQRRGPGATDQKVLAGRRPRGLPPLPGGKAQPDHVRIRAAGRA